MEAFKALDRDQTQFLDPKNLVIAFSTLGRDDQKLDQDYCRNLINMIATDEKDKMNYEEFIKVMTIEPEEHERVSEGSEDEQDSDVIDMPLNFKAWFLKKKYEIVLLYKIALYI